MGLAEPAGAHDVGDAERIGLVGLVALRSRRRGEDVVATLERVCSRIGYPKTIRVDQGPEFISRDMDI